ncbi:hypothetical protein GGF46_005105 [Coemansia sp. RSA 552]|nr:hypothetical protein GGF46_005105 [Coemansia sp. RSA 552]
MTPPNTAGARDMLSLPASDSKYGSQTATARGNEQRRARMQRRKTEGQEELHGARRPHTSHASSTARKVTYSQYPDFETIKDPFAKRDRIPRRSEHPFTPDKLEQAPEVPALKRGASHDNGAVRSSDEQHGSGLQTPVSAPLTSPQPVMDHVPTPLRKNGGGPPRPRPAEPVQMEVVDMQLPESPVTPTQANAADMRAGQKPPISPAVPFALSQNLNSRVVPRTNGRQQQRPPGIEMDQIKTRSQTQSSHNISPRLQIDMNNVDTLYARRSLIFENKMKRASKIQGTARVQSPLSADSGPSVLSRKESLGRAQKDGSDRRPANRHSYMSEDDDDDEDKESEDYIPFEQVLIPTAFKRLRTALEDPLFEVDEETYLRFKLSERWYAREEHRQEVRRTRSKPKPTPGERQDQIAPSLPVIDEQPAAAVGEPVAMPPRVRTASSHQSKFSHPRAAIHDSGTADMSVHSATSPPKETYSRAPPAFNASYAPPPQAAIHPSQRPQPGSGAFTRADAHSAQGTPMPVARPVQPEQRESGCCACTIM